MRGAPARGFAFATRSLLRRLGVEGSRLTPPTAPWLWNTAGVRASWRPYVAGAVAGLAIGLTLGFVVGNRAGCGAPCGFDVGLFGAAGTWVGGVVIAGAVASYTLASQRDAKLARKQAADEARAARDEAALQEARALAVMCAVRFTPLGDEANGYGRVDITFTNNIGEMVFWPKLLVGEGLNLGADEQVWPGRAWGKSTTLKSLGLDDSYATENDARAAINSDGRAANRVRVHDSGYAFRSNTRRGAARHNARAGQSSALTAPLDCMRRTPRSLGRGRRQRSCRAGSSSVRQSASRSVERGARLGGREVKPDVRAVGPAAQSARRCRGTRPSCLSPGSQDAP